MVDVNQEKSKAEQIHRWAKGGYEQMRGHDNVACGGIRGRVP